MSVPDILEFSGEYRWLSNFWTSYLTYDGVDYCSVEHAYQASKTTKIELRWLISRASAGEAKGLGRRLKLRPDWESIKDSVMLDLLRLKFQHPHLREKLIATGNALLVEGNRWGDTYWGVCNGVGENTLGKLLMVVREEAALNP